MCGWEFGFTYLDLPLVVPYKLVEICDPIIEEFSRKLASWKGKIVFGGGILVLIKSTNIPLVVPYKLVEICDPIIEEFSRKLASWKGKIVFGGGILVLIKSTLPNLLVYYLSLFTIPKEGGS